MKINLRQARRLERDIATSQQTQNLVLTELSTGATQVTIHQPFADAIDDAQTKFTNAMNDICDLNSIRFSIRKGIETQNEVSGINALMNQEAMLKDRLKALSAVGEAMNETDQTINHKRHAALEISGAHTDTYGRTVDYVTLQSVITEDTMAMVTEKVKAANRVIAKIVEQLGVLNSTTLIELSDVEIAMIEKHDIIV